MSGRIHLTSLDTASLTEVLEYWQSDQKVLDKKKVRTAVGRNELAKYIAFNSNPNPLRRVLSSVFNRWNVVGILESPYIDLDFLDHYAEFYSRIFASYPAECSRLHFFSVEDGTQEEITEFDLNELCNELKKGVSWENLKILFPYLEYKGYSVLRPTKSFVVGRTAIRFDSRPAIDAPARAMKDFTDIEVGGKPYLCASMEHEVNLLATKLTVPDSVEFIQQDPNLGACATASIWVATRILSKSFNLNKFAYPTITRQATNVAFDESDASQYLDYTVDGGGLYAKQICSALSKTGANPRVFGFAQGTSNCSAYSASLRLRQELYSFVESGIPVIMLMSDEKGVGHAVVAVGHNLPKYEKVHCYFDKASLCMSPVAGNISEQHFLLSSAIPLFYTHDDRYGPFNRVTFASKKDGFFDDTEELSNTTDGVPVFVGGKDAELNNLIHLIAPLPPAVRNTSLGCLAFLLPHFDFYREKVIKFEDKEQIYVWRSLLVEGSNFKKSTVERGYNQEFIEWYAGLRLPKYVWLFEYSLVSKTSASTLFSPTFERKIQGEFLFDPTTPEDEPRCLTARFFGYGRDYTRCPPDDPEAVFILDQENSSVGLFDGEDFVYTCYTM